MICKLNAYVIIWNVVREQPFNRSEVSKINSVVKYALVALKIVLTLMWITPVDCRHWSVTFANSPAIHQPYSGRFQQNACFPLLANNCSDNGINWSSPGRAGKCVKTTTSQYHQSPLHSAGIKRPYRLINSELELISAGPSSAIFLPVRLPPFNIFTQIRRLRTPATPQTPQAQPVMRRDNNPLIPRHISPWNIIGRFKFGSAGCLTTWCSCLAF